MPGVDYTTKRIYSLWNLEPGDHIRNVHAAYSHHMLVVEVFSKTRIKVIHYTSADRGKAVVREEVITLDPASEIIEVIRYSATTFEYSASKAIRRARSKIGEEEYRLFNNNCETMVNWALTGEAVSKQGDRAKIVLTGVGIAAGIGIGFAITAIIVGALTGDKKK